MARKGAAADAETDTLADDAATDCTWWLLMRGNTMVVVFKQTNVHNMHRRASCAGHFSKRGKRDGHESTKTHEGAHCSATDSPSLANNAQSQLASEAAASNKRQRAINTSTINEALWTHDNYKSLVNKAAPSRTQ